MVVTFRTVKEKGRAATNSVPSTNCALRMALERTMPEFVADCVPAG